MASKDFLVDINLNKQQLLNAALQSLAVFPSTIASGGVAFPIGYIFWHTGDKTAYCWTGTTWLDLGQVYTHPPYAGTGQPATPLSGSSIISKITLENGHVTGVETRNLTPADIGASTAIHTHVFSDILGLPANTIIGNNTSGTAQAKALTVSDLLTMLSIGYGTIELLNIGTDTLQRTYTPKDISDYVTGKLSSYLKVVNLALGTRTSTTQLITNSAGTGFTLPSVTTTLAGLMSAADKLKLDGVATGANNYIHPTNNPGTHPFASEFTSGVQVLSQLVVDSTGHTISIKGRNLTYADLAPLIINDGSNSATQQTWSGSKIYSELQNAVTAAQTGALIYKGDYNPVTNAPAITLASTGVKKGWTYVVSVTGTFLGEQVEAGDMIIAKEDGPLTTYAKWQIVNKNIPTIVDATTTIKGILRLATITDYNSNDNTTAITPALLRTILGINVGGQTIPFGDGSSTSFTLNHTLNTQDVILQIRRVSTKKEVIVDWGVPTASTVTIDLNVAPANGELEALIKK